MNKPEESSEETKMNEEEQRKREESRREREDAEYDLEYRTASAAKKTKTSGVKLQDAKQSGDDKQIADATRQYMEALSRYESDKGALNRENESKAKEQKSGDDATIVLALRKLTGSQSKFESLAQEVQRQYEEGIAEDATDSIKMKVESAGTFSAYQAQAWGGGMDGQRKLYEENKRQTEYLRRLVDLMGSSSALFT